MQLTIDLPNICPGEKITQLLERIEQIFIKENVPFEIKTALSVESDSWDDFDIEEISVDAGIADFAQNHDSYGTHKTHKEIAQICKKDLNNVVSQFKFGSTENQVTPKFLQQRKKYFSEIGKGTGDGEWDDILQNIVSTRIDKEEPPFLD
jgi:hypothetical protein